MTPTLLILGADGDLTRRLLLPGLATLLAGERFEDREPPLLIGAGLGELTTARWRTRVREAFAAAGVRSPRLTQVVRRTRYRPGDVTDPEALTRLLEECDGSPVLYFALPPAVTRLACEALAGLDLPEGTTLALEKPFGTDLDSAARLNHLVTSLVPEERVFRVDHFLGRADVLNVLGVRFANRLLEPVWNHQHVASIEVVYDEDLALEGRAGYYDRAGALVDMVQSHLLQVMALLMMEPVASLDERSFRDAKNAVLRATRLAGDPASCSRRARYTQGRLGGRTVPAYTRESGVDPRRGTETLAAITVEVRNHRWAGVPVTLRSGKALGKPRKEAVVRLRPVPHLPQGLRGHETSDTVTIGFQPPRLAIHLDVSGQGDPFDLDTSRLSASLDAGELTAYGEVLAGILDGDPLLSVRGDSAEECWRIVEPVLGAWRDDEVPMDTYAAGSGGPWAISAEGVGTSVEHVHEHQRFDDAAATWDDDPSHEKRQMAVARAIEEAVNLNPRMSAVDVGGGTGRLSILLADLVGTVVVTDPSAGMVQVARERIQAAGLGERLRAVQADLATDRLDGTYDVVWSSMALHHVQDLDGLLRSVARLLVDGGRLAIADLDEDPDGAFHADKVDFDGHHGFNRQRLAEQLVRAGFSDVSFVDSTTILKDDREFGVFLCTATKAHEPSGDH